MIYLSRLILNPRGQAVWRSLADCQALYRTIMTGFPEAPGGGRGARKWFEVLYRVEASPRGGGPPTVLVQSVVTPDWSLLPQGYLLETGGNPPNPQTKRVDDRYAALVPGTVLRFRLRANPTRKIDTKSGPDGSHRNGRRVELRGDDEQVAWLRRKGAAGGFDVLNVRARPEVASVEIARGGKVTGDHPVRGPDGERRSERLTFAAVVFDGNLVVTDRERFLATLERGIGSAKAYGFGLLSIARAETPG